MADSSLLRRTEPVAIEEGQDGPRFGMLETIREFGLERLADSGKEPKTQRRHAAWCLRLAEQAAPRLVGQEESAWRARLVADHDNLRAALRWAEAAGEPELGIRLGSALWWFWLAHGHLREGRDALQRALARAEGGGTLPRLRARALTGLGYLAVHQGDLDGAGAPLAEALALWRGLGDRAGETQVLQMLGMLAEYRGDDDRATARYEEALALYRGMSDQVGVAGMLENLADAAYRRGERDRATELAQEALAISRSVDHAQTLIQALVGAAQVAVGRADHAAAAALVREAIVLAESVGYRLGLADEFGGAAAIAATTGRAEMAVRLLAAAMAVSEEVGAPRLLHHEQYRRALSAARAGLDEAAFAAEWAAGRALGSDQTRAEVEEALDVANAVAPAGEAADATAWYGLTPRELEVLRLVAEGRSDREIGQALSISHRTVMRHVEHILAKLGVDSCTAAATQAVRANLV